MNVSECEREGECGSVGAEGVCVCERGRECVQVDLLTVHKMVISDVLKIFFLPLNPFHTLS